MHDILTLKVTSETPGVEVALRRQGSDLPVIMGTVALPYALNLLTDLGGVQETERTKSLLSLGPGRLLQLGLMTILTWERFPEETREVKFTSREERRPTEETRIVPARWWRVKYALDGAAWKKTGERLYIEVGPPTNGGINLNPQLCVWPFGNVHGDGKICWGVNSNDPGGTAAPSALDDAFLRTPFNSDLRVMSWTDETVARLTQMHGAPLTTVIESITAANYPREAQRPTTGDVLPPIVNVVLQEVPQP